ncbi:MAG: 4Fe-4S dicluster domain-containing protein [Rhodospirillales bacterium]|jgi:tetrathionate reductase subunit B|nr:4Fe-4S dicluster domain-containing protein [Rhodospirillales bacterium]
MPYDDSKVLRRDVLKGTAVAAAGAVAASTLPTNAVAATAANTVQYAMVIDARKCNGCHACSVACKTENNVPLGETRTWVEVIEKGEFPNVSRNFLPRLCNHCSEPDCVKVCPTGATYKREEDGIVTIDKDICIGCKYCVQACPYGARFINPISGTAEKCDFCLHRVKEGVVPSCVNTCQARARTFGDMNDPESDVAKLLATEAVTTLRTEVGTKPNVYYIGADHTDPKTDPDQYVRIETNRRQQERV